MVGSYSGGLGRQEAEKIPVGPLFLFE